MIMITLLSPMQDRRSCILLIYLDDHTDVTDIACRLHLCQFVGKFVVIKVTLSLSY